MTDIQFYNRQKNCLETEKVYGNSLVQFLYDTAGGRVVSHLFAASFLSKLSGVWQDHEWSKAQIPSFIKNYDISMDEFLPEEGRSQTDPYKSFNQFFIRRFKEGQRHFVTVPSAMPAFCEARYFGHASLQESDRVQVKGKYLRPKDLLNNLDWGRKFENGPILVARLCPVDYHRFHFPDDGKVMDRYPIHGQYHSVNPVALKQMPQIFIENERMVTILETKNFGTLAYIEVGAMCVGKIVQSYKGNDFKRGEEKGYFLFGGSTVVLLGEKGKWLPDHDILENTKKGIETYLKLGEQVASSKSTDL